MVMASGGISHSRNDGGGSLPPGATSPEFVNMEEARKDALTLPCISGSKIVNETNTRVFGGEDVSSDSPIKTMTKPTFPILPLSNLLRPPATSSSHIYHLYMAAPSLGIGSSLPTDSASHSPHDSSSRAALALSPPPIIQQIEGDLDSSPVLPDLKEILILRRELTSLEKLAAQRISLLNSEILTIERQAPIRLSAPTSITSSSLNTLDETRSSFSPSGKRLDHSFTSNTHQPHTKRRRLPLGSTESNSSHSVVGSSLKIKLEDTGIAFGCVQATRSAIPHISRLNSFSGNLPASATASSDRSRSRGNGGYFPNTPINSGVTTNSISDSVTSSSYPIGLPNIINNTTSSAASLQIQKHLAKKTNETLVIYNERPYYYKNFIKPDPETGLWCELLKGDDYSRVKVPQQLPIASFWALIQPWLRPLSQSDLTMLLKISHPDPKSFCKIPDLGSGMLNRHSNSLQRHATTTHSNSFDSLINGGAEKSCTNSSFRSINNKTIYAPDLAFDSAHTRADSKRFLIQTGDTSLNNNDQGSFHDINPNVIAPASTFAAPLHVRLTSLILPERKMQMPKKIRITFSGKKNFMDAPCDSNGEVFLKSNQIASFEINYSGDRSSEKNNCPPSLNINSSSQMTNQNNESNKEEIKENIEDISLIDSDEVRGRLKITASNENYQDVNNNLNEKRGKGILNRAPMEIDGSQSDIKSDFASSQPIDHINSGDQSSEFRKVKDITLAASFLEDLPLQSITEFLADNRKDSIKYSKSPVIKPNEINQKFDEIPQIKKEFSQNGGTEEEIETQTAIESKKVNLADSESDSEDDFIEEEELDTYGNKDSEFDEGLTMADLSMPGLDARIKESLISTGVWGNSADSNVSDQDDRVCMALRECQAKLLSQIHINKERRRRLLQLSLKWLAYQQYTERLGEVSRQIEIAFQDRFCAKQAALKKSKKKQIGSTPPIGVISTTSTAVNTSPFHQNSSSIINPITSFAPPQSTANPASTLSLLFSSTNAPLGESSLINSGQDDPFRRADSPTSSVGALGASSNNTSSGIAHNLPQNLLELMEKYRSLVSNFKPVFEGHEEEFFRMPSAGSDSIYKGIPPNVPFP